MKKLFALTLLLLALPCVQAQYVQKMDFHLRAFLARPHQAGDQVDLFIHGNDEAVSAAVKDVGGIVKRTLPRLVSARVPVDKVSELAQSNAVHHFEFTLHQGVMLNDSMRVKNRVNQVQQGLSPLPQGYDGTGVVMGYVDSGLDIFHPDFRTAEDSTRVYKYWDQVPPPNGQSPSPFGYGVAYTKQQLSAGGFVPTEPIISEYAHGTTVIGTGSGNGLGNGRHKGVAPGSEIIVVASPVGVAVPNWPATVADGVDYIFREASAMGKPAVVNASLGSIMGSHDGKDAAALFIEQMLNEQGGRSMVAAAGNFNAWAPYHLHTDVGADTTFTWFIKHTNSVLGDTAVVIELWADAVDFDEVNFAIGYDRIGPPLLFRGNTQFRTIDQVIGQNVVDTLFSTSGNRLGVVQYYAAERGEQIQLQVVMVDPDSTGWFRLMSTGNGKFDLWGNGNSGVSGMHTSIPTPANFPPIVNYVLPDNNQHMVDSWACLSDVITVANYNNEVTYVNYAGNVETVPGIEGDIANNSSKGPTRDLRQKPDIAASGDVTFTAAPLWIIDTLISAFNGYKVDPGGMHIRQGGTSIAAPVVAGTAALFYQRCPTATAQEILKAMTDNAYSDNFTPAQLPDNRWGAGKLDAFKTLLNKAALIAESTTFCEGSVALVDAPEQFSSVIWNDASTVRPKEISAPETVFGLLETPAGCIAFSDTLEFTMLPAPPMPVITAVGPQLTSSAGPNYQWYRDGEIMDGEIAQVLDAPGTGFYTVEFTATNGCTHMSEPEQVLFVAVEEQNDGQFALWPNPVKDQLTLELPGTATGAFSITLIEMDGKVVRTLNHNGIGKVVLDLGDLAAGPYAVRVQQNNTSWTAHFVKLP